AVFAVSSAETISTGISLPCSRIHCKNENPSCPGSTTSNRTMSGCSRGNASRAASAESASAIRYLASSALRSPYLAARSSSTIKIVFMVVSLPRCFFTSLDRQGHLERCSLAVPCRTLPTHLTAKFRHSPRYNRQSQSRSLRFRCKEGLEDLFLYRRR